MSIAGGDARQIRKTLERKLLRLQNAWECVQRRRLSKKLSLFWTALTWPPAHPRGNRWTHSGEAASSRYEINYSTSFRATALSDSAKLVIHSIIPCTKPYKK